MQSLTFGRAFNRVVQSLRIHDLVQLLQPLVDADLSTNFALDPTTKQKFSEIAFDVEIALVGLNVDPSTASIVTGFGLDKTLDRRTRTYLLSTFQAASAKQEIAQNRLFWVIFYRLWAIETLEKGFNALVLAAKTPSRDEHTGVVELWIEDYAGEDLTVDRLEHILQSIRKLYASLSEYLGVEKRTATIAYLDSGTEFTIGLKGAARVIDAIRIAFQD